MKPCKVTILVLMAFFEVLRPNCSAQPPVKLKGSGSVDFIGFSIDPNVLVGTVGTLVRGFSTPKLVRWTISDGQFNVVERFKLGPHPFIFNDWNFVVLFRHEESIDVHDLVSDRRETWKFPSSLRTYLIREVHLQKQLIALQDQMSNVIIWSVKDAREIGRAALPADAQVYGVIFDKAGDHFTAFGSFNSEPKPGKNNRLPSSFCLHSSVSEEIKRPRIIRHSMMVWCAHYFPDGKSLILGGGDGSDEKGYVAICTMPDGKVSKRIRNAEVFGGIQSLAISTSGDRIGMGTKNGNVVLINIPGMETTSLNSSHKSLVLSVAFDRTGNRLASGGADGQLMINKLDAGD